jgi:hypothetical protein
LATGSGAAALFATGSGAAAFFATGSGRDGSGTADFFAVGAGGAVLRATGGFRTAVFFPGALRASACALGVVGSPCCLAGASTATPTAGAVAGLTASARVDGGLVLRGGWAGSLTGGTGRRFAGDVGVGEPVLAEPLSGEEGSLRSSTAPAASAATVTADLATCPATMRPIARVFPVVDTGWSADLTARLTICPSGFLRAT